MNDVSTLPDSELMQRYARGDRASFQVLLERHQGKIYNFCMRFVGHSSLATELTQETFLRLVKARHQFRGESRFTTWLYSIARNLCIDELRRRKNRPEQELKEETLTESTYAFPPADQGIKTDHKRFAIELARALNQLPVEQREVFILRHLSGFRFTEIADMTHQPLGTVKSRMRYALERLQAELETFRELVGQ
ncbi:MAG: sigma-70 family RNA polymerase sigma factor [Polyangiaceae bacterium]|nr:sigma-70 family RNA polymerase sigma factor [Polyangiaceae bacterium]